MAIEVVGQERALAVLARAAQRPAHAYLLVGPRGSGVEDAARTFAAMLVDADERGGALIARGVHPDVVEVEPDGATYLVDHVRERIIAEAHRAPVEGASKVILVLEAEKLSSRSPAAPNALLKTLEEPPPRTVLVLVAANADELLPTIRSRCQRVDFDALSDDVLRAALERDGIEPATASLAAGLAGGQLARARALAGPLAEQRRAFASVAARVDGTGARSLALAEELDAAVEAAAAEVARRQADELGEFDAEMERHGYEPREVRRLRRKIEERHKREARRTRIDLLLEGVTALESVYRDVLVAPAPPRNADLPLLRLSPRAAAEALDACREAREAFLVNEKGLVRLIALVMALPPATA